MARAWWSSLPAVAATATALAMIVATLPAVAAAAGATALDGPPALPKPLPIPGTPITAATSAGYLPGSGEVTPSGEYTYRIPLAVPAGRAGMAPSLELGYSSQAGNGAFGVGWALAGMGSSITRCGRTLDSDGAVAGVRFDASDRYCVDGRKLVALGSGTYGAGGTEYRTEVDTFSKIVSVNLPGSVATPATGPDRFQVFTKDGRIRTYTAYTAQRRQSGVAGVGPADWHDGAVTISTPRVDWQLESERDRSGNEIRYQYTPLPDSAVRQLTKILYTSHVTAAGAQDRPASRWVEFEYENGDPAKTRPDVVSAYAGGVAFTLTKRVTAIKMFAPNPGATALVWRYPLTYKISGSGRSVLSSVTRCGGAGGGCLRAKEFGYADPGTVPGFSERTAGQAIVNTTGVKPPRAVVADFDGDGTDDLLYTLGAGLLQPNTVRLRLGKRAANGSVAVLGDAITLTGVNPGWPAEVNLGRSRPVDLDGNGRMALQVRYSDSAGLHDKIMRWDLAGRKFVDTGIVVNTSEHTDFADLDGDGRMDYLADDVQAPQEKDVSVRLNTGGSFGPAKASTFTPCWQQAADVDGDGRAELVGQQKTLAGGCSSTTYLMRLSDTLQPMVNGASTTVSGEVFHKALPPVPGFVDKQGDFNGDGLADVLLVAKNYASATVLWNTGYGLTTGPTLTNVIPSDQFTDVRVADVNGDGRDDLVAFKNATTVLVSKGDGTFVKKDVAGDGGTLDPDAGSPEPPGWAGTQLGVGRSTSQVGDFDGDGLTDIVRISGGYLKVLVQNPGYLDRLQTVTDQGTAWYREKVSYSTMWSERPGLVGSTACAYPLICLRRGLIVVRQVRSKAHLVDPIGPGSTRTVLFSYEDPVTERRGRGFLGFGAFRVWGPQQPSETVTTFNHRAGATPVAGFHTRYPYAGIPYTVTTTTPILTLDQVAQQPGGATARITATKNYEIADRSLNSGKSWFTFPAKSYTKTWDQQVALNWGELTGTGTGGHVTGASEPATADRHVDEQVDFDGYGNRTYSTRKTIGGTSTWVNTAFDNRKADWLISLPTTQTVMAAEPTGGPATTTRTSERHYDGLGRLDAVYREKGNPNPDIPETAGYSYDGFGVLTGTTVAAAGLPARVTHLEYAPVFPGQPDERIFPSQAWAEHDQQAHRPSVWLATHPGYGVIVASEDANGVTAAARYDDLGRPVQAMPAGAAPTSYFYVPRTDAAGGTNGTLVTSISDYGAAVAGSARTVNTFSDALGRPVKTVTGGFSGAGSTVATGYDLLGRVVTRTRPYAGTTAGAATAFGYDSLDRPTVTTMPDGKASSYAYPDAFTTRAFDAAGDRADTIVDADGRVTKRIELLKNGDGTSTPITTSYGYRPFDLLGKVTDDRGNVTAYTYDVRGRRVASTDPDRGSTTSAYYGTGLLRAQTRTGTGHTVTYGYDDLGRLTSGVDEDGTTSYTWDTAANGIGRMASATSPDNIRTDFRYDAFGRLTGTDYTDGATTYQTDQTYDAAGRPSQTRYPLTGAGRFTTQNVYNALGSLATITGDAGSGVAKNLWMVTNRNADDSLDTAIMGNGLTMKNTFDPATGRLLGQQASSQAGAVLQSLAYTYHDDGLLKTRVQDDGAASRTEAFGYDSIGRLTGWDLTLGGGAGSGQKSSTYRYDSIGNITPDAEERVYGSGAGTASNAGPHALAWVDPTGGMDGLIHSYTYDKRGREILDEREDGTTRATSYTAFDLPRTVTDRGRTTSFAYDAFGTRVRKTDPDGASTFYVPGLYEKRTAANGAVSHVHYVNGPDGPIAQVAHDGITLTHTYLLTDRLGSTTATADAAGKISGRFYYEPFGRRVTAGGIDVKPTSTAVTHGFGGHELDGGLGLVNMRGRVYDPVKKAFLTPDPVVGQPADSQAWNPYSYVRNDPVNHTDPSGLITCAFVQVGECEEPGGGATSIADSQSSNAPYVFGGTGWMGGEDNSHRTTTDAEWQNMVAAEVLAKDMQAAAKSDGEGSTTANSCPPNNPGCNDQDGVATAVDTCPEEDPGCADEDGTPEIVEWLPNAEEYAECSTLDNPYCDGLPAFENPGGGRIQDKRDPAPSDLVKLHGVQLHYAAADALDKLIAAAREDGIGGGLLLPVSGYRSYEDQAKLFDDAVKKYGTADAARQWVAPPGSSPHQSGRAVDVNMGSATNSGNAARQRETDAYKWMVNNAKNFGFYPYEKEPWHWEYNPPAQP